MTAVPKEHLSSTSKIWKKKSPISRNKWKAINQLVEKKEWESDEVELKLNKDEIKFEDFDKVEIRVAEVKEVSKVEGSMIASIPAWMLVMEKIVRFFQELQNTIQMNKNGGKKVQIVANLKPRKMMKKICQPGYDSLS